MKEHCARPETEQQKSSIIHQTNIQSKKLFDLCFFFGLDKYIHIFLSDDTLSDVFSIVCNECRRHHAAHTVSQWSSWSSIDSGRTRTCIADTLVDLKTVECRADRMEHSAKIRFYSHGYKHQRSSLEHSEAAVFAFGGLCLWLK